MAKKKQEATEGAAESTLVHAAKTIGTVAGKVAAAVGATPSENPHTKSSKVPKLAKKNKSRLPRRQKKAAQKAAKTK